MIGMMAKKKKMEIENELAEKANPVNWQDYNYPPSLKLIHF